MHDLSPVHTSGSTPKRGLSTRWPALSRAAVSGRTRRWRSSWHSARAMITLSPPAAVVIASLTTSRVAPTRYGFTVLIQETPRLRMVSAIDIFTWSPRGQPGVPEAAVSQDRDHPLAEARRHRARRGHAHAVAEDRVALVERRQRREGVAAD